MLPKRRIIILLFVIIGIINLGCIVSYAMPENLEKPVAGDNGQIKGTVKNLTLNQVVPNQEVLLYIYKNQREVGKQSIVSDGTGSFKFIGLEAKPAISYRVMALYQDVEYSTKIINLAKKPEQDFELNVFSVSDDDSKIQAAAHHLILEPIDDGLYVTEYIIMANSGNTSFLTSLDSGNKVGFRLQLPKGYRNLNFQQGFMECCVSVDGNTLLYSHATQPGMTTFVLNYHMAPHGNIELSRQLFFNTNMLFALVSGNQAILTSTLLKDTNEQTNMQGKSYDKYAAENLNKGQIIDLQLELPSRGFNPIWLAGLVVVLGLAAVLVIRNITARKKDVLAPEEIKILKQNDSNQQKQYISSQTLNRENLASLKTGYLELINRLDEMYESGEISQYAYHIIREEQKGKLGEIMAQLEKMPSA